MLDGEHEHSLTIQRDSLESTAAAAGRDQMVTTASAAKLFWPLCSSCSSAQHLLSVRSRQLQLELQNEGT